MPHSHHSHSGQFCRHAKDTLEAVVVEAIRQGFQVFGLSEHCPRWRAEDLFPEEVGCLSSTLMQADLTPGDLLVAYEAFLAEALRLRAKYPQISLLIGLETDYITPLDLNGISRMLEHPEIDYLVGSVHHVNGISIDFDQATWAEAVRSTTTDTDLDPFISAYLDAQYELMTVHQPEVIGHFDLCLLYTPEVSLKRPVLWEKVERNVRYAAGYGALFEANAAALRKGWSTSYPSKDVLEVGHVWAG
jgi:histidinol-phosphatase (PHP family)